MDDESPRDIHPHAGSRLDRFLAELKRRRIYRLGGLYVAVSWGLLQGLDIILPALSLPDWILTAAVVAVLLGFPIAIALGWAFDVGPGGIERTTDLPLDASVENVGVGGRLVRMGAAALIVLAMATGGWWWLRPDRLAGTVAEGADVIAVVPFSANGAGVMSLGEGMVDLLSANLDEVGAIRTINARRVMRAWQDAEASAAAAIDPALATGAAVGAGSVVVGSVVEAGGDVQMNARLLTLDGQELASAQVRGPTERVLTLVDSLTIGLVREIWRSREPLPDFHVAAVTTGSLVAIRAYLTGEVWYRRSQWDSAAAYFGRAVEVDTSFALAHHRLASTYGWLQLIGSSNARFHATTAYEQRERLPERERALVSANYHFYNDDWVQALDSARAFVERSPDDADGWYQLGDIQYHSDLRTTAFPETLLAPFERVIELDPTLTPALFHPIDIALALADSALYRKYLDLMREHSSPSAMVPLDLCAALVWGPNPADSIVERIGRLYETRPGMFQPLTSGVYRSPHADPAVHLDALRALAGLLPADSPDRARLRGPEIGLLTTQGRVREARPIMLEIFAGREQSVGVFLFATVASGLADTTVVGGPLADAIPDAWTPGVRLAWHAAMELGAGNPVAARTLLNADVGLEAGGPGTGTGSDQGRWYRQALLGWLSLVEGDADLGSRHLGAAIDSLGTGPGLGDPTLLDNFRLRQYEALARRADTRDEGLARLRTFAPQDLHVEVARQLAIGEALETAGQREEAAAAYGRFLEILKNADPEFEAAKSRARRGLQRTT